MHRQLDVNWSLPHLNDHQPNCSLLTDELLKYSAYSHWPITNGITRIGYRFDNIISIPYFLQMPVYLLFNIYMRLFPTVLDTQQNQLFRKNVRAALKNWEAVSDGLIQFYEDTTLNPWANFINFQATNTQTLKNMSSHALTILHHDTQGYFNWASIVLPDNPIDIQNDTYTISAYHHEIGHALGLKHLHENPEIKSILANITDGIYCSVMPYINEIITQTNQCHDHCVPPYATLPGPTDGALIKLIYGSNRSAMIYDTQYHLTQCAITICETIVISDLLSNVYHAIHSLISHLALEPNKKLFTPQVASLLANGIFISWLMYNDVPMISNASLIVGGILSYILTNHFQFKNEIFSSLFNHYHPHLLNLSLAYVKGQNLLSSFLSTVPGVFFNILLFPSPGSDIGKTLSTKICNAVIQPIYKRYTMFSQSSTNASHTIEESHEPSIPKTSQSTTYSSSIYQLFNISQKAVYRLIGRDDNALTGNKMK